jgi:hypothetical protein
MMGGDRAENRQNLDELRIRAVDARFFKFSAQFDFS